MEQLSSFLANLFTQISASPLKAALAYSTAECTLQGLPTEGKEGEDIIRIRLNVSLSFTVWFLSEGCQALHVRTFFMSVRA